MGKPLTIDEYLAGIPPQRRKVLEKLRKTIRKIIPQAEECISYSIPAFRLQGKVIAGFQARSSGFSYFPFSGSTLAGLNLKGYGGTKSAVHFTEPLPEAVVRRLLKARIAELRKASGGP